MDFIYISVQQTGQYHHNNKSQYHTNYYNILCLYLLIKLKLITNYNLAWLSIHYDNHSFILEDHLKITFLCLIISLYAGINRLIIHNVSRHLLVSRLVSFNPL